MATKPKVREARDLNELISVRNNTHGVLVYVSKKNMGMEWVWNEFGDEDYLELSEVLAMRNTYPRYFKDCWVMLDKDVLEYLGVDKYYKDIIDMENFDDIFKLTPTKLKNKLKKLPQSMRESVATRARQMIKSGKLDSIKIIKAIEQELNIDLSL